jgi:chemotaxis signal transduction protein
MIMQGTTIEGVMTGPSCMAGKMPFYKGDIPIINPLHLLPFPCQKSMPDDSNILMIQHDKADFYGFAVDRILGVRQIEKGQFLPDDPPPGQSSFSAITGRVWLEERTIHIIDPRQLLSPETMEKCRKALF